jgi:hypothetical protein
VTLLLLLAIQAGDPVVILPPAPAVGDTIVVERVVPLAADGRIRAQPIASSLLVEPLGEPVTRPVSRGVQVRYALAMFEPGRHALELPPVEVLYRDGRVDQVSADTAWITVVSLLPPGDSLPAPRASRAPLARFPTRIAPLAILLLVVLGGAGAWIAARRGRRRFEPVPARPSADPVPPLERWSSAGEARAVASVASSRLRDRIARLEPRAGDTLATEECIALLEEARPDWPLRVLSETLRDLERARFAPAAGSDVGALVKRVEELLTSLDPVA